MMLTPSGQVDRPVQAQAWIVPAHMDVDSDSLIWSYAVSVSDPVQDRLVSPDPNIKPGLFSEFLNLGNAQPPRILRYARTWGVLGICQQHAMPHSVEAWRTDSQSQHSFGRTSDGAFSEPLDVWRRYAKEARALMNIARRLHGGKHGDADDWRNVTGSTENHTFIGDVTAHIERASVNFIEVQRVRDAVLHGSGETPGPVRRDRERLTECVSAWLDLGRARPLLTWHDDGPQFKLYGAGLFGNIAIQLMLAVDRSDGWTFCTGCDNLFPSRRKVGSAGGRYCDDCRRKGRPVQDAKRRQRRRETGDSPSPA